MLRDGKGKDEIVEYLTDATHSMGACFLVEDLLHLKKGGRINTASLVIANMLDIKPMLAVKDGLVVQDGKLRGNKRVMKKLVDKVKGEGHELSGKSVFVVTTACKEKAAELQEELENAFDGVKCINIQLGSIIGCHAGPDLVGFVYSDKYDFFDYED